MRSNTINVNMRVTAETVRARQQLKMLQSQLGDLLNMPGLNNIFSGTKEELDQVLSQTAQLRAHLLASSNMKLGLLDFADFNKSLRASGMDLTAYGEQLQKLGPQGQAVFNQLAQSVVQAEVPMNRANAVLSNFFNTLKNNIRWQLTSELVDGFIHGIQGAIGYAEDLDRSLNDIRIVSGQSADQMARFAVEANKAAKELNSTTVAYTDASLIYFQQGGLVY